MSTANSNQPVFEMRVAVTTSDYQRLVKFYCDGLGIEPAAIWNNGDGQALVLNMGNATLEIFDEPQAELIDQLEAGKRVSGQIRFALQVPNLQAAMERLLANGATLVHPPVMTPWGDYNVRLQDPDGMQITLFQPKGNQSG
jgi:predicted enzyme related to lactoylglutathione lyase